ncbi:pseudouridine synthase family protein [Actinidia rufa]|uniref:Pseudouridine synthase family protein n=1 Tax=Actinidia rufa TaxID=165716 RepID=A0A7J0EM60_9ERIC|nr:pseudouridine synthase family protein [Actinidia rufa]
MIISRPSHLPSQPRRRPKQLAPQSNPTDSPESGPDSELGFDDWVDRKLTYSSSETEKLRPNLSDSEMDKSRKRYYSKRRKRMYGSDSEDDGNRRDDDGREKGAEGIDEKGLVFFEDEEEGKDATEKGSAKDAKIEIEERRSRIDTRGRPVVATNDRWLRWPSYDTETVSSVAGAVFGKRLSDSQAWPYIYCSSRVPGRAVMSLTDCSSARAVTRRLLCQQVRKPDEQVILSPLTGLGIAADRCVLTKLRHSDPSELAIERNRKLLQDLERLCPGAILSQMVLVAMESWPVNDGQSSDETPCLGRDRNLSGLSQVRFVLHLDAVIQREPWEHIKDHDIKKTAASFCGEIWQVPPMFSASK